MMRGHRLHSWGRRGQVGQVLRPSRPWWLTVGWLLEERSSLICRTPTKPQEDTYGCVLLGLPLFRPLTGGFIRTVCCHPSSQRLQPWLVPFPDWLFRGSCGYQSPDYSTFAAVHPSWSSVDHASSSGRLLAASRWPCGGPRAPADRRGSFSEGSSRPLQ